jgi:hypothetical protein
MVNITGSALVVITSAISVGISHAVGYDTPSQLIKAYRILLGFLGAIFLLCTVPFFIVQKHRPGQQLPEGSRFWLVGFTYVQPRPDPMFIWPKANRLMIASDKCGVRLRVRDGSSIACFTCLHTLCSKRVRTKCPAAKCSRSGHNQADNPWAASGTYFAVTSILQNDVLNYSPEILNAMLLVADLSGGLGTLTVLLLQRRYHFSIKSAVQFGSAMAILANIWGAIGTWTHVVGFHQVWHFWMYQVWNFMTACWGSYSTTMISEVVPAPKAFMFFALFSTVGKTSSFIGPFVTSAIINRAGGNASVAYWFLVAMGIVGWVALWFVDTDEAKRDNERYLQTEADEYYSEAQKQKSQQLEMVDAKH